MISLQKEQSIEENSPFKFEEISNSSYITESKEIHTYLSRRDFGAEVSILFVDGEEIVGALSYNPQTKSGEISWRSDTLDQALVMDFKLHHIEGVNFSAFDAPETLEGNQIG